MWTKCWWRISKCCHDRTCLCAHHVAFDFHHSQPSKLIRLITARIEKTQTKHQQNLVRQLIPMVVSRPQNQSRQGSNTRAHNVHTAQIRKCHWTGTWECIRLHPRPAQRLQMETRPLVNSRHNKSSVNQLSQSLSIVTALIVISDSQAPKHIERISSITAVRVIVKGEKV